MSATAQRRVAAARSELSRQVQDRYREFAPERDEKLERVDRDGVLAAAGARAAARRAAHMSRAEGARTFEAVVGFDDSDHVNFLARGQAAARAVCRLTQDRSPVGTGFLVAPGLLLTNNHVIESAAEASSFVAEFDYELDPEDSPRRPVVRFQVTPERGFVTSGRDDFDFTFVALAPVSSEGNLRIEAFGWLPMDERTDKILEGEPAVIVQHPRGDLKRLCLFSSELVDRRDRYLHYTTDTDGGSSGSPVTNRGWQLVALHHAAVPIDRTHRGNRVVVNEGIRVSRILEAVREDRALEGADREAILARLTDPQVLAGSRGGRPAVLQARREAPSDPLVAFEATNIRRRARDHFEGRPATDHGYKTGFLGGGLEVPLPTLPSAMKSDAATIGDTSSNVLTYTHYSVVHSKSRRLPIVTAVNIDGAKSQRLGREDRDFEAADKWYYDPRIDEDVQLDAAIYDGTPFDFGHMVRREDPVWGDLNTARMANDDTFYMTNCTPQHSNLNQRTWLSLENAVLKAARDGRTKVSVFTGPILSPQDPTFRGVQIPTAFWKIVAYRAAGRLRAHGFMQWQNSLVDDVLARFEDLTGIEAASEYQVPIRDIARDSALDFGALVDADEDLGGTDEGLRRSTSRRRLTEGLVGALAERIVSADTDVAKALGGSSWSDSFPSDGRGGPMGGVDPSDPLAAMEQLVRGLRGLLDQVDRRLRRLDPR